MSAISHLSTSAGPVAAHNPSLNQAQSAARAKAMINSLPVGSSINHLTRVLGGVTLTLGANRQAAAPEPAVAADAQARHAVRQYAAIDATTKPAGSAPDGRTE